jgi:hypothetical protein
MTRIEYSTDEQLQQMHAEALHILHNLRFHTKHDTNENEKMQPVQNTETA